MLVKSFCQIHCPKETHGDNFYDSKNPLVRRYANKMIETVGVMVRRASKIRYANTVLDYGCGTQRLKKELDGIFKYIGYDDDAVYSAISINKLMCSKPDIIVFSHVLEHMTPSEIDRILSWATRAKFVVTALPTENLMSKVGDTLFWKGKSHIGHNAEFRDIYRKLKKKYTLLDEKKVMTMSVISLWKV